jgi:hypothetical protein
MDRLDLGASKEALGGNVATTKRAQYRFVVKEGPSFMREIREGVLEPVSDAFITAEPCGTEPVGQRPLKDPDFLSFDLGPGPGLSLDEAQRIADFLNEHVPYVAITRFGDAEDAARDVKQSERLRVIDLDRFSAVIAILKEKLAANDTPAAVEAVKAVESVMMDLINGWSKALVMSREILDAFGEGGDRDAT